MANDALLEAADRLYGLPLPEFTPRRDELAKELKADDKELSAQVKALKKASVAAWVVNLLVRRDPDQVTQVLQVGEALRQAQDDLDATQLRELTRQRRQLTSAVTGQARRLAVEHGQKVTQSVADQVEATLTAAMIDPGAAEAVRSGLLLTALASTGVGESDLTGALAVPELAGFIPSSLDEPEPPGPPELHVVPDPDADAKKRAAAQEALAAATTRVEEADAALGEANAAVAEVEARSLQVQAEIEELRRRIEEHETEQDAVDDELEEARAAAEQAREELSVADADRRKAEQALARLR